jgi:hypothetical protein
MPASRAFATSGTIFTRSRVSAWGASGLAAGAPDPPPEPPLPPRAGAGSPIAESPSIRPGVTTSPLPEITRAPAGGVTSGPTAVISPSRITTVALS